MRKIILLLFLIIFSHSIYSQKEDYIWIFGYDNSPPVGNNETYYFDFNKGSSPVGDAGLSPLWIRGNNASICDAEGNLLFYTNGCHVADSNHMIMPNGSGINEGVFLEEFRQDTCAHYPGIQDVMILSDPADENGYYLLHKTVEYDGEDIFINNVKYTYIDLTLNEGSGDVTEKNIDILPVDEVVFQSYLIAISKEDKQGWWISIIGQNEEIILIHLDNNGFSIHDRIKMPVDFVENSNASGATKFSPDGSGFAFYNAYDNLLLYDFDRSNGDFSNLRQLNLRSISPTAILFSSVEWSPNSRFLYVAIRDELWQVDTWEDNLEDGLVLIDTWNGVQDPFNTTFFLMASAPDCKIYMCSGSGTFSYHVINKPNEKGVACDFVQQGIRLPFASATATMPNFPRFRVDEDDKCDPTITSIFGDDVYYRRDMTVYPNPVRDMLNVEIPEGKKGRIVVFDMMGRLVYEDRCPDDKCRGLVQIDLSGLAVGTYSVEFLPEDNKERLIFTAQVVKVE